MKSADPENPTLEPDVNEDRPTLSAAKMYCSEYIVSGTGISFMRIFVGVLWTRVIKRQWVNQKRRFSGLLDATPSPPLLVPCRLSTDTKIHDIEWPFYVKFPPLGTELSQFIFRYLL